MNSWWDLWLYTFASKFFVAHSSFSRWQRTQTQNLLQDNLLSQIIIVIQQTATEWTKQMSITYKTCTNSMKLIIIHVSVKRLITDSLKKRPALQIAGLPMYIHLTVTGVVFNLLCGCATTCWYLCLIAFGIAVTKYLMRSSLKK